MGWVIFFLSCLLGSIIFAMEEFSFVDIAYRCFVTCSVFFHINVRNQSTGNDKSNLRLPAFEQSVLRINQIIFRIRFHIKACFIVLLIKTSRLLKNHFAWAAKEFFG